MSDSNPVTPLPPINPRNDGVDHINCWSKGKTELGQQLSNFAHTPFKHPEHGFFASMEAYWYWCASGRSHNHLRRLYGASAKNAGTVCDPVPMDEEDFHEMIREGLRCKIGQNDSLRKALAASTLPLEHYFVYGKAADVIVGREKHRWQMDCLEWIRAGLKKGIQSTQCVSNEVYIAADDGRPKLQHTCVPSDTKVVMQDGSVKPANEIQVGEELQIVRNREAWEDW